MKKNKKPQTWVFDSLDSMFLEPFAITWHLIFCIAAKKKIKMWGARSIQTGTYQSLPKYLQNIFLLCISYLHADSPHAAGRVLKIDRQISVSNSVLIMFVDPPSPWKQLECSHKFVSLKNHNYKVVILESICLAKIPKIANLFTKNTI